MHVLLTNDLECIRNMPLFIMEEIGGFFLTFSKLILLILFYFTLSAIYLPCICLHLCWPIVFSFMVVCKCCLFFYFCVCVFLSNCSHLLIVQFQTGTAHYLVFLLFHSLSRWNVHTFCGGCYKSKILFFTYIFFFCVYNKYGIAHMLSRYQMQKGFFSAVAVASFSTAWIALHKFHVLNSL